MPKRASSRREFLRSGHWSHGPELRLLTVREDADFFLPLDPESLEIVECREAWLWSGFS